jgi:hypothetical protein|tara:strand:+ start:271 stop:621 length:351 start_codon:yes stop_codon:yes gene_type:complete
LSHAKPNAQKQLDPVLVHARREAIIIMAAFVVCMAWSVPWCYMHGYGLPADEPVQTVFGVPSWIFYGVIIPWILANIFSIWFCMFYMALDPLGEDQPDGDSVACDAKPGHDDGGVA